MKCVNEEGLAVTHANVPPGETPHDAGKPQFRHNFVEKIVAECSSVKQAIALVQAYSLPPTPHGAHVHLMLADSGGDSAIVEWAGGEAKVIRRSGTTQMMTNTLLSTPSPA
jgi:penicillin V acylase-like amidase (Ntn superfamily)